MSPVSSLSPVLLVVGAVFRDMRCSNFMGGLVGKGGLDTSKWNVVLYDTGILASSRGNLSEEV